ncbi:MAG TPA: branched-chain amino acid ABC transporter substrate-binding protein [Actinomycetota bacterium]
MRKPKWHLLVGALAAVSLIAAACGDDGENGGGGGGGGGDGAECPAGDVCVEVPEGSPIKVGTLLVITGENASLGLDGQHGVELSLDYYDGAFDGTPGEVAGHPVELVHEDDGCSAEGGTAGATNLAADPELVGVVGTSCSGAGEPASQILSDAQIVLISPSNTAPSLTDPTTHQEYYLRTAHNDKVQGAAMAQFVSEELGLTTAATIHDGSPYADQLQQVFTETFTNEFGGEVSSQEAVQVGDTDFGPLLTSIAAGSPEFLYYPIFVAEGGLVTAQAREVPGLSDALLGGADGMLTPDWIEAAGAENAEGVFLSGPDLEFASGFYQDEFIPAYEEQFGEPTSVFHAHAFDATTMLLETIEEVAIEGDGVTLIPRVALKDAMFGITGFEGILGSLDCTPTEDAIGDCNAGATITVSQVQGGEFVVVWPEEKASGEIK